MVSLERFMDALESWGDPVDEYMAKKELVDAAIELLRDVPGVTGVFEACSSMGSIYLDLTHVVDGEEESFTVRLSNHKRKPNGHATPVWSFEVNDSEKSVRLGLLKIQEAAENG